MDLTSLLSPHVGSQPVLGKTQRLDTAVRAPKSFTPLCLCFIGWKMELILVLHPPRSDEYFALPG